jgi:transcription elongation factor Elf1
LTEQQEGYPLFGCAFCLYANHHWYFETKLKNGKASRMLECPNCKLRFRQSSLIKQIEFTPDSYAKWIVEYPFKDFWHKINFDLWKKNLQIALGGQVGLFWERYHYWKNERAVVERPQEQDQMYWDNEYQKYVEEEKQSQ